MTVAAGRLPHVPGGSGKDAEADGILHAAGGGRYGRTHRNSDGGGGPSGPVPHITVQTATSVQNQIFAPLVRFGAAR